MRATLIIIDLGKISWFITRFLFFFFFFNFKFKKKIKKIIFFKKIDKIHKSKKFIENNK